MLKFIRKILKKNNNFDFYQVDNLRYLQERLEQAFHDLEKVEKQLSKLKKPYKLQL